MSGSSLPPRPLESARLDWNDEGMPISVHFDDIYFSNNNGLDETRFVFLQHNGLPERWASHDRELFVIGETGFGTGLNFLASWQAFARWRNEAPASQGARRLHFISFEKYPLTRADLAQALARWPELAEFSAELVANYPDALFGCHRLLLAGGTVVLDLWFGDIKETLPLVADPAAEGIVDGWFLDGFAPSKNPDMWNEALFAGLARLARPHATLSTFTCAGFVRRGLIAAGFAMQKVKGHGCKRQMLAGQRTTQPVAAIQRLLPRQACSSQELVVIRGGGIASAALALALTRRGRQVEIWCKDAAPAMGASGNRQGALYPLLNAGQDTLSQFYATAFGFARRLYTELMTHYPIPHDWCGVVQLAHDDKSARKLTRLAEVDFPPALLQVLAPDQYEVVTGLPLHSHGDAPMVHYPQGGWLCPEALTRAMLEEAKASGHLRLRTDCEVLACQPHQAGWQLTRREHGLEAHEEVATLVLANGHLIRDLLPPDTLPLGAVRGQVSHLATTPALSGLKSVLCYAGYLTPAHEALHCLGASFIRNDTTLDLREEEHLENLQKLQHSLPACDWAQSLTAASAGRVAVRAAFGDHLPMAGLAPAPQQAVNAAPLWLLGGLGSRGLCSAPLLAELLACELTHEPLPLSGPQLQALHPQRFAAKGITQPL